MSEAAAGALEPPEWTALAERDPGAVAIALPDAIVTVGELEAAARRTSAALVDAGVRPGECVVAALPNGRRFVEAYLAARHCGAVFVNAPWQWRRELVAVADETGARAVLLDRYVAADAALRPLASRVLPDVANGRANAEAPFARDSDARAWIAYSSGTTGAPKGAVHSERTLRLIPEGFIDRYGIGSDDAVLVAAPVGHAVGCVYGVALALRARCPMALQRRWDVAEAAALARRHRCTFTAAPTPLLLDAVETAEREGPETFDSLRHLLSGGSSVPASLLERARKALPGTETSSYYGTSECGGVTSWPPGTPEDVVLTGDGVPLPGMEVALGDGDELLVRGAQMALGYVGPDVAGRFRADGWYATGDRATIDAGGAVRIAGRRHDVIRRGGVDVAPAEVEEVLASHAGVHDVAVCGLADPRLGARVAAVIVPVGDAPSLQELRAHCERHGLAKVKWPERVAVRRRLPRSATGKLARATLPRLFERTP